MQAKMNGWMGWTLLVMAAVLLLGQFGVFGSSDVVINVDEAAIAAAVVSGIEFPEPSELDNDKLDYLYKEASKDEAVEALALELVMDAMDDKDFERALVELLEDEVEVLNDLDYRDITSIVIRDSGVDLDGEEAFVEVEFKAYVNNYGDDDEEERARLVAYFVVEDLVEDDDYEDAEAFLDELELVRFYD